MTEARVSALPGGAEVNRQCHGYTGGVPKSQGGAVMTAPSVY